MSLRPDQRCKCFKRGPNSEFRKKKLNPRLKITSLPFHLLILCVHTCTMFASRQNQHSVKKLLKCDSSFHVRTELFTLTWSMSKLRNFDSTNQSEMIVRKTIQINRFPKLHQVHYLIQFETVTSIPKVDEPIVEPWIDEHGSTEDELFDLDVFNDAT